MTGYSEITREFIPASGLPTIRPELEVDGDRTHLAEQFGSDIVRFGAPMKDVIDCLDGRAMHRQING